MSKQLNAMPGISMSSLDPIAYLDASGMIYKSQKPEYHYCPTCGAGYYLKADAQKHCRGIGRDIGAKEPKPKQTPHGDTRELIAPKTRKPELEALKVRRLTGAERTERALYYITKFDKLAKEEARKAKDAGRKQAERDALPDDKRRERSEKAKARYHARVSTPEGREAYREAVRKTRQTPEYRQKNNERMREYNSRPEVQARRKERKQRPEVQAKEREYRQRPDVKERQREYQRKYAKEYNRRPDVREKQKARAKKYNSRPDVKERRRACNREYYLRYVAEQKNNLEPKGA